MAGYRVDGNALKKAMIDNDIKTIRELSELSGVNRNTCAQVLDEKTYPSSDVMSRLAEALNLDACNAGKIFFMHNLRNR